MRAQLTAARPAERAVGANFLRVFTKESNCTKEIHTNEALPTPSGVWRHRGPTSDAERRRLEPRVAAERSDAAARGEGVDARHREEGRGVARPASETVYSDPQIDHSLGSFLPNRRVLHKKAEPAPKALRA